MNQPYKNTIIEFITRIGIPVRPTKLADDTFIPGIKIIKGELLYDDHQILSYGDLIHEAGHIALMSPSERREISGNVAEFRTPAQDDELAVILWTYAVHKEIDIPIEIIFHEEGYKGDSEWLINQLQSGQYIGLPLLAYLGLL